MGKVLQELKEHMDKSLQALQRELNGIRTGRASTTLLDGIKIDYYGTSIALNQIATISTPESRTILIQPWDSNILGEIEKSIQKSDLGLQPMNDGKIIRISIPSPSEERRKELVKLVKKMGEECKIALRNHRRNVNEVLKKLKAEKKISEDEYYKLHDDVQRITDEYVSKCDAILVAKEKEILEY